MIDPAEFCTALESHDFGFFTGVPDSLLKDLLAYITTTYPADKHVIAANEGSAVALASGHYLATGKPAAVYMQNSGIGNAVNPLLSLADELVYSIPMLLVIGWRGEPGKKKDEPQHLKQGKVTLGLLEAMGIEYEVLDPELGDFESSVARIVSKMNDSSSPVALVVSAGTFSEFKLSARSETTFEMSREDAIERIVQQLSSDDLVVSTTGMASRELFEVRERLGQGHEADFLTVGSMGHCSQIALGLALSTSDRQIVCIDGDGAALMHLGSMAITAQLQPSNYLHIVINNGAHDSVGGQPTAGRSVDIPAVARANGYAEAGSVETGDQLAQMLEARLAGDGPALIEIKVRSGARFDLGRPNTTPVQNKTAFMENARS
jgi:phosphonopyruvate decarboxylase